MKISEKLKSSRLIVACVAVIFLVICELANIGLSPEIKKVIIGLAIAYITGRTITDVSYDISVGKTNANNKRE